MVLISMSKRFVYIKNCKVAGSSVEAVLQKYTVDDPAAYVISHGAPKTISAAGICGGRQEEGEVGGDVEARLFFNHMSLEEVKEICPDWVKSFTTVCVVRNPWDQVVSGFHFAKDKNVIPQSSTFESFVMSQTESWNWSRMCLDDRFCIDFVIKFESLSEDLKRLATQLDLELPAELPHFKRSASRQGKPYRQYYNDKTRQHVADIYEKEIAQFGYNF